MNARDEVAVPPDAERVSREVAGTSFAGQIHSVASVASTNDEARRLAAAGAPDGTVVMADRQTAGRGRRGRRWHSTSKLGLYLSVLFRLGELSHPATRWTLAAAVAACAACRELTGRPVEIKWPNDLIHGGRKLGGILAEMRSTAGHDAELVIGIGINVGHRQGDLPAELTSRATSLFLVSCDSMLERETLAGAYLRQLALAVDSLRHDRWAEVAEVFERLSPGCRGVKVSVVRQEASAARRTCGVTGGIDSAGALLVRDASGRISAVRMADAVQPVEG